MTLNQITDKDLLIKFIVNWAKTTRNEFSIEILHEMMCRWMARNQKILVRSELCKIKDKICDLQKFKNCNLFEVGSNWIFQKKACSLN